MLLIGRLPPGTVMGMAFVELLAHPEVTEEQVLVPPVGGVAIGFLALHGGLEPGTAEIAVDAARRAGASWYVIHQPDSLKRHVPSHEHDPADEKDVIVEIRQGVGGDEAAIWAGDL